MRRNGFSGLKKGRYCRADPGVQQWRRGPERRIMTTSWRAFLSYRPLGRTQGLASGRTSAQKRGLAV